MQRGQVTVGSACATPSSQFSENKRSRLTSERSTSRASSKEPNTSDADDSNPPVHHQYQPHQSSQLAGAAHDSNRRTGGKCGSGGRNKRSPHSSSPCIKFQSQGNCRYGSNCRFSHELQSRRPTYPGLWAYENPFLLGNADLVLQSQFFPVAQRLGMPAATSYHHEHDERFPSLPMAQQRERASSLAAHFKPHTGQKPDDSTGPTAASPKLLFKEAVLKQSKMKNADKTQPANLQQAKGGELHDDSSQNDNQCELSAQNRDTASKAGHPLLPQQRHRQQQQQQQPQRRKKVYGRNVHPFRSGHSKFENGAPTGFYLSDNYLFSDTDNVSLQRAEYLEQLAQLQQQQQLLQQQYYLSGLGVAQLVQAAYPPYLQYAAEEYFFSGLSREAEAFVDHIDSQLAALEVHQQQAIDSLQGLVRSLWPDALIDVYGSNYTRLTLPKSDVDCVLVSRSLASVHPLSILESLAAEMEQQPWTKHLDLLGNAKIPVLKIAYSLDPTQKEVLLDLTCGHSVGHTGLGARDLIYSYQAEMPALRPLVVILKSHVLSNDLNCAFTGGLSSYVLVIMAIRFLQACGDSHQKSFGSSSMHKFHNGGRRRSFSENASARGYPEELAYSTGLDECETKPKWCYTFTRQGRVTWRTSIANLLMLFLETYITFDYRRFGISIEDEGEFFLLPSDHVVPDECSTVIPYVADPLKPGRNICNCFRMHEVIQAWSTLYQNLAVGTSLETCVSRRTTP